MSHTRTFGLATRSLAADRELLWGDARVWRSRPRLSDPDGTPDD